MDYNKCPNCGKSLTGFLKAELIKKSDIDYINQYLNHNKEAYCTNCYPSLFSKITSNFAEQKSVIEQRLQQIIHYIPVLTSPAPVKWNYEVIGMVSSQTTSGTGFMTELSRSFNDFFGSSSNATNQKIVRATNLCKADLQVQCVRAGGNCVISTDIDFNEIGAGSTNMLMVCMAGTAIHVTDMTNFNPESRAMMVEIVGLIEELKSIPEM